MASELKVDTIKHTNNTSAITLDTSGNVTLAGSANNIGTVSAGTFNGTLGSSASFPVEHYRWTSGFTNSWNAWDWSTANQTEQGIRVRRMGPLYIVDMSINKTGITQGTEVNEKVLEFGSNITHPTNTVFLGLGNYVSSAGTEYFLNPYIDSNGHLYVRGYNSADTTFNFHASFIGLDVA